MLHGGIPMIRISRVLAAGAMAACLLVPAARLSGAEDAASQPATKPAETAAADKESSPPPAAKPCERLSQAQVALRDHVREVLAAYQKQPFNTRDNSATEIMDYCLAFGCATEVTLEGPNGKRINGITSLCWNYPCAGFEMLGPSQKHVAARIGYGCQEQPGELLAMLAMSRVQADYPVRVGKTVRTVADLVEAEKLGCRSGSDLSLALIGLACYVDEPEWKNDLGETWSLDRIIEEELAQPAVSVPEGGLNRLLGLSYAVVHKTKTRSRSMGSSSGPRSSWPTSTTSPCGCRTRTAVGGRIFWRPGAPAPTRPRSCDRPAACWSGWRSRSPTNNCKTPGS